MFEAVILAFLLNGACTLLLEQMWPQHTRSSILASVFLMELIVCAIMQAPLAMVAFLLATGLWYLVFALTRPEQLHQRVPVTK